jgi:uncharacterized protein YcnI
MPSQRPGLSIQKGARSDRVRLAAAVFLGAAFLLVGVGVLHAHVTVSPGEVRANASERFTVRVPSERPEATVKVRLEFPEGLGAPRFLPKAGWTYEVEKDASGKVTAVTWSGGEIGPQEFDEFVFIARTPEQAGTLTFHAHQTYKSGTVVKWVGPSGGPEPAAVVEVMATAPEATPPAAPETSPGTPGSEWMGGVALAVSLVALALSVVAALKGRA